MKKILLFCSTLFLFFAVYGQGHIYPVQANVNVVAPYSLYLSDYVSGSKERLIVTLLNRDVQYPSMPVRLRLSIKGNGFSIQTRPYASVSPITLEPNVPYKLTVDDLMPYFDTRNLLAQGLGGDSYLKGGRLPEGMIEFGIEVLEYGTSKVLSQRAIGTAWLALQKPPLLSLPFQDEVIPWREPLNLLFQWTPQHSGVARVEYELIIKELWDNGLAPESAFAWSPEIFRERITSTSYLYGTLAPALEPGRRYAWAVRVVAKDGADDVSIFENEGLSMIRSFRIARYCPEPVQVKATAERGYIHVEWESAPEHIDYTVAYRVKGAETWAEVRSTFPSALLSGVRPGYTYEYRVGGFCEPLVPTFGKTAFLTLPSEDTTRLRNCGMLRPVDLSNQDPLDELLNGDQFIAGDFPVHVQEVTGSQGFFTGNGYVHVPFLAYAPFKVTFDNVYINTDRRMIRGVVKTVYDPTESGMGNMDDIFTGGGHTGNVVEGITKTDLRADFVIDKDSGFFFDETTGKIEVTDASGQVIGYIETGHSVPGGGEPGGNNGNAPSVFPMTVKDSEGNIYEVEEAPEDGSGTENEGAGENPGSGSKKQLVVTPVGKSGDGLNQDEVNFKRLDSRMAEVVFTDTEGSLYAFDAWKAVYSGSYLIRTKYEQLGESYRVPAKLIPSGKKDKVGAVITVHDPSVDPDKVIFKTRSGTEFKREKFDKTTGRYVLNLVRGNANDGQELYALYPKPGGGYYNLGKLLIVSYPSYRIKVKIVPVANDLDEFEALRGELEKIYSRVGIECVVEKMPVFAYSSPLLFADKSGVFSAYTDEMKKLQGAYVENYGIDPEASYLFVLLYSGQGDDRNYTGFMPLNKQFGYLFRRDFGSFEEFAVAAAHELAHGRLSLRHPFDKSLGLPEGSVADNLMDYRHGRELAKWQWDVIHDPGIVLRVFEQDEDAAKVNEDGFKVQEALRIIRLILTKEADYRFRNLNVLAKNIQIGNNKYQKIKINTVSSADEGSNSPNMISFENLNIELSDKVEAEKMRDFLYGIEKDIYGKSDKKVVLNGEEITLDVISRRMEEILLNLLNRHKYDQLTYKQKIILNIPIIQWKLGYYYGAAFMYCWFNGENRKDVKENNSDRNYIIKIDDQNFLELFLSSSFFQDHLDNTVKEIENGNLYNVPTSLKCLANIKRVIESGGSLDINMPGNYEMADPFSSDYASFLYSHAVSFYNTVDLSNNTVIDDDFAYAIGSFAILVSMEGRLEVLGKDAGIVMFSKLSYRLWDSFDFVGDQTLGKWNGDVFDATKVSLVFTNVSISNKDFRDFYQIYTGISADKGKILWDLDIVTKNNLFETGVSGLRYNIDALGIIKSELIK